MPYKRPSKKNVFRQIYQNISDSNNGLKIMFKESSTIRRLAPLEIIVGAAIGIIFGFNALEYIIMALFLGWLFIIETMNTAVEKVNDLVTLEENELVKQSKDLASASVWICHIFYIITVVGFMVMHLANFAWWNAIIPG
ncbi:diacylglycerol kinase [Candidatus Saccharibacteria bacterium]|nr:diacylglycerol kinase [Candidatus Saccharibacteria bacterium]